MKQTLFFYFLLRPNRVTLPCGSHCCEQVILQRATPCMASISRLGTNLRAGPQGAGVQWMEAVHAGLGGAGKRAPRRWEKENGEQRSRMGLIRLPTKVPSSLSGEVSQNFAMVYDILLLPTDRLRFGLLFS